MKLFYCVDCGAVRAFNLYDILKHDLRRPCEYECKVCGSGNAFVQLEEYKS